jgi:hypothetical protein
MPEQYSLLRQQTLDWLKAGGYSRADLAAELNWSEWRANFMTKQERKNCIANFQNRRSSRITHLTSGYEARFGDAKQNAVNTITQKDVVDDPDALVAHQDNVDPNLKGEITGVIDSIQKAIETVGDTNPQMSDSLKQLLPWGMIRKRPKAMSQKILMRLRKTLPTMSRKATMRERYDRNRIGLR